MFKKKSQEVGASFEAKDEKLPEIRNFVESFCQNSAVSSPEISKILLAIEEACSNVIRHAYVLGPGNIKLEITRKGDRVTFSIKDKGRSFELGKAKRIDLKKYIQTGRKGGLGLQLIQKIMDEVIYQSKNGENELVLSKKIGKTYLPEKLEPKRFSLRTKLVLSFSLILLVCVGFFYYYFGEKIQKQTFDRVLNSNLELINNLTLNSKDYLFNQDDLGLANLVFNAKKGKGEIAYLLILDREGKIWASTSNQTDVLSDYKIPAGINSLLYNSPQRYYDPNLGYLYHIIQTVTESGNLLGSVHLGLLESKIKAQIQDSKQGLINILSLILVFGFLAIYISSSWLVQPLRKFKEDIKRNEEKDGKTELSSPRQDEIGEIAQSFQEISSKFKETQKLLDQEKIKQEVELAYHIQKVLLPQSVPQIEGFEIATIYKPAQEVGGDYFDFIWVDKDNLGVVVADVSGKGVTASMYMSMLRTALRLVATGEKDPKKTLVKVNQLISADLKKGHFVTVFYLILNIPQRIITYTSAGHNPLILYSSNEDKFHFLNPKGIPLGLVLPEGVSFEQKLQTESLALHSQDWLFLYSDGITEAMNSRRETFGREKLLNLIKENKNRTAPEFSRELLKLVTNFTEGASPADDITLVALKNVGDVDKEAHLADQLKNSAESKSRDKTP